MVVSPYRSTVLLHMLGLMLLFSSPFWLVGLYYGDPYFPATNEIAVLPMLIGIALVAVVAVSRRDSFLGHLMFVGLMLKLVACAASLYLGLRVYNGATDAVGYIANGRHIAEVYRLTGQLRFLEPFWSSNFIRNATGVICIVLGPSMVNATVFFALLGFWGQYLAFRAFRIAYPQGDARLAGLLLFLLPSIVFWPSAIGKDALALLFIGLTSYGYARLDRSSSGRGVVMALPGLFGLLCVRPHVAGMLAMAFVVPYAFATGKLRASGIALRLASVVLLIFSTAYFARSAQEFIGVNELSQTETFLQRAQHNSNYGSSAFGTASPAARILAAPVLFFRPFPWEVHNLQAAIAAGEGLLLLVIGLRYHRQVIGTIRRFRQSAFTFFILIFLVEFSITFSAAISNFGLLTRERVMAAPLLVILICITPKRVATREARVAYWGASATTIPAGDPVDRVVTPIARS